MAKIDTLYTLIARDTDDCILWPHALDGRGYGTVWHPERRKMLAVHRLACEAVNGPSGAGMAAAHSCGVPSCCNPRHLRWATYRENERDKLQHGTHKRGERNPGCKLKESQVLEILSQRGKVGVCELGRRYGVSHGQISDIMSGKKWGWLSSA